MKVSDSLSDDVRFTFGMFCGQLHFIAFHWCGLVVHIEVMVASAAMATACWATHPTLPWLPLTPQTHQHRDLW